MRFVGVGTYSLDIEIFIYVLTLGTNLQRQFSKR